MPQLAPLLAGASAMIVRVRIGSGLKLKALDAFAHSLPPTTLRGIESTPIETGEHALNLSRFPDSMRTLQDAATNAAFSARCRVLFDQRYAREAAYPRYAAAFLDQAS